MSPWFCSVLPPGEPHGVQVSSFTYIMATGRHSIGFAFLVVMTYLGPLNQAFKPVASGSQTLMCKRINQTAWPNGPGPGARPLGISHIDYLNSLGYSFLGWTKCTIRPLCAPRVCMPLLSSTVSALISLCPFLLSICSCGKPQHKQNVQKTCKNVSFPFQHPVLLPGDIYYYCF